MRLLVILLTLSFLLPSLAFASDDDRVSAVTDFLLKRAEENAIYMFELRLKRNEELACNLPQTYSYIEEGNLRLLLKNKELWKQSVEKDLLTMVTGYAGHQISKGLTFLDLANRYIEATQYLGLEFQGETYPLNMVPLKSDQAFRELNYGFYNGVIELDDAIRTFQAIKDRSKTVRKGCDIPAMTLDDINLLTEKIKLASKHLKQWSSHVKTNSNLLIVDKEKIKEDCQENSKLYHCKFINKPAKEWLESDIEIAIGASVAAIAAGVALNDFTAKIKAADTYTGKVMVANKFFKMTGLNNAIKNSDRLTHDLMFFAELADAKDSTGIQEVLTSYTLPPVTFGNKREHQYHVMVTAYLTAAAGTVLNSEEISNGNNNRSGIYAPVGLELSRGYSYGSLSLMLAPFDFGYPINLKLNGVEKDINFDEVVAPSVALSYGWKNYPVSLGLAYQRGRKTELTNEIEQRAMIFLGIDMPLLSLY